MVISFMIYDTQIILQFFVYNLPIGDIYYSLEFGKTKMVERLVNYDETFLVENFLTIFGNSEDSILCNRRAF